MVRKKRLGRRALANQKLQGQLELAKKDVAERDRMLSVRTEGYDSLQRLLDDQSQRVQVLESRLVVLQSDRDRLTAAVESLARRLASPAAERQNLLTPAASTLAR